jgi:uncharacterized protein with GYD domain
VARKTVARVLVGLADRHRHGTTIALMPKGGGLNADPSCESVPPSIPTRRCAVPKFLVKARYTSEGAKGVQSGGGTSRREAIAKMAAGLGGSLESFYFAFGETDAYVVLDLPDNRAAAAAAIAVGASGAAGSEVVVLLTPEDVDAAAGLSVDYRPPGS